MNHVRVKSPLVENLKLCSHHLVNGTRLEKHCLPALFSLSPELEESVMAKLWMIREILCQSDKE